MKKESLLEFIFMLLLFTASPVYAEDIHLSTIKSNDVLYFGTSSDYVPFVFYDDQDKIIGLDVSLIEEIADRIGVTLEVIDLAYEGLIDSVIVGQVDLIGGALLKTAENEQLVDFSRVYYLGTGRMAVLNSTEIGENLSLAALSGKRIGFQQGTNFDQWVRTNLVGTGIIKTENIVPYPVISDAMTGLLDKEVDFVLLDQNTYNRYYKNSGSFKLVLQDQIKEEFAFASHKGSSLIPEINRQLNAMILDGTAQTIAEKFFTRTFKIENSRVSNQMVQNVSEAPETAGTEEPDHCTNAMRFAGDITIPDGSKINSGASFTKIWRIFNLGSCTWDSDYNLVQHNANDEDSFPITGTVLPGAAYDFPVVMTAPAETGNYKNSWQLQTPEGTNFGQTIWVNIQVINPHAILTPESTLEDDE
ncbi:MAG: transporter substrate-binding domain-containing protein [Flexilinea sp.]